MKRVRSHITVKEASCRDGCGLMSAEKWLDTVNMFLDMYGKPVRITNMVSCKK